MYTFHPVTSAAQQQLAFTVYQQNVEYFRLIGDDQPTLTTVAQDANELPPDMPKSAKHYQLIKLDGKTVGVVDWVVGYPQANIVYLGLLMIADHRKHHGQNVVAQLITQWRKAGFTAVQLGVVVTNTPAMAFWQKMGFAPIRRGSVILGNGQRVLVQVMQRAW